MSHNIPLDEHNHEDTLRELQDALDANAALSYRGEEALAEQAALLNDIAILKYLIKEHQQQTGEYYFDDDDDDDDDDITEQSLKEAIEIYEELCKGDSPHLDHHCAAHARTLTNLGYYYLVSARARLAEHPLGRAEGFYSKISPKTASHYQGDEAHLYDIFSQYRLAIRGAGADHFYSGVRCRLLDRAVDRDPERLLPDLAAAHYHCARNAFELIHAAPHYLNSICLLDHHLPLQPQLYLPRIADALNNVGLVYVEHHLYDKAELSYLHALHIYEYRLHPLPPERIGDLADLLENIGVLYRTLHDHERAEAYLKRSHKLLTQQRYFSVNNDLAPVIASVEENLALVYCYTGVHAQADELLQSALRALQTHYDSEKEGFLYQQASVLCNLGFLHEIGDKLELAQENYLASLKLYKQLMEIAPYRDEYQADRAMLSINLASIHWARRGHRTALSYAHEGTQIYKQLHEEERISYLAQLASSYHLLAKITHSAEPLEAEPLFATALDYAEQLAESEPERGEAELARQLDYLGVQIQRRQGRYSEARASMSRALALYEKLDALSPDILDRDIQRLRRWLEHTPEQEQESDEL